MMRSYFPIACMVFAAYALVLVISVANAAVSQITTAQNKILSQAETTNDFLMRNLTAVAADVFETEGTAINAMTKPYSTKLSAETTELINEMKTSSAAVDRAYFFNLKDNVIYTGDNPVYNKENFPDKELLALISSAGRYTINVPHVLKYEYYEKSHEKQTLVSLYKYSDTACMAVFIDSGFYNSMINADFGNPDQEMIVLSSSGTVVSSTRPELFGEDMSEERTSRKIYASDKMSGHFFSGGTIYCYSKSDTLNSVYICTIALSSILVSYSWQIIILILFAALLVFLYLMSSIRISMSVFRPFKQLRDDVFDILDLSGSGADADPGTDRDLELIAGNLVTIKNRYDAMRENELMYTETKRSELVYYIITGTYNYSEADLYEYRISFENPYNTVMLIRLDNTKQIERSGIGPMLYGIANAGTELFTGSETAAYYTTFGEEYDIVFLINHKTPKLDTQYTDMLQKYAKNAFGVTVSVSFCTSDSSLNSVSELYRNAKYAMQYRLVRGCGAVIEYSSLLKDVSSEHEYPVRLEKAILREINLKNKEKVAEHVDEFIKCIRKMPYVYITVHSCVLIMAIIAHTKADSRLEDHISRDIISDELMSSETLDDIKGMIMAKCSDALITSSDAQIDDKYMMIANSIQEYIDSHYTDPNLSIDVIASHVNKSANYTRSIFKQNKGVSISEYISQQRFNEVCRLLRETNLTAQQISQRTGMSSSSYFYTAFKKYTGYTLEQYRKKHMHD